MADLDRATTLAQVQEVLMDVLNLQQPPRPTDRLVEDLGAESVDVISLLFEFEERLGRRIPDAEVAQLTTVDDIVERVLAAPAAGAAGSG
ncbi:MAG TPA: acyl carrier protein [Thermoanaerobaculia bacterium]|nr:acyl carrier protein [Thermoanaerobaculia bacterium]